MAPSKQQMASFGFATQGSIHLHPRPHETPGSSIEEFIGEDLRNVLERDLLAHCGRVVGAEVVETEKPLTVQQRRPTCSEVIEADEAGAAVRMARLEGGGDEAGVAWSCAVAGSWYSYSCHLRCDSIINFRWGFGLKEIE